MLVISVRMEIKPSQTRAPTGLLRLPTGLQIRSEVIEAQWFALPFVECRIVQIIHGRSSGFGPCFPRRTTAKLTDIPHSRCEAASHLSPLRVGRTWTTRLG